jgi:hypothetical protein
MGYAIIYITNELQKNENTPELNINNNVNEDEENGDNDNPQLNVKQLNRLMHDYLDILVERTHDNNAYTRSTVLKVWILLLEKEALSIERVLAVGEIAFDRLNDKTSIVRKSSLNLLTTLLDYNPFSGNLNIDYFMQKQQILNNYISERKLLLTNEYDANHSNASTTNTTTSTGNTKNAEENDLMNNIKLEKLSLIDNNNVSDNTNVNSEMIIDEKSINDIEKETILDDIFNNDNKISTLMTELNKCNICLQLLTIITNSIEKVKLLLSSKCSTDVLETLKFYGRAVHFSINGSAKCLQR